VSGLAMEILVGMASATRLRIRARLRMLLSELCKRIDGTSTLTLVELERSGCRHAGAA
jgi:hypothetical protein